MAERNYIDFTLPPGRLVQGSLTEAQTTDAEGKPLIVKSGPNMGQPRIDYYFAVAVPKTPGVAHWASEEWGAPIWAEGHASFPGGQAQRPDFAWKIVDGDSQIPNKAGRKPCEQEGFPCCWVVRFSGGKAPQVYSMLPNQAAPVLVPDPKGVVGLGDYVQVRGSVCGNGAQNQPGVYLNHSMICLRAYGQRISTGPDVSTAGFGGGALPAGASATPLASAAALPPPPAAPGAAAPMPAAPSAALPPPPAAAPAIPGTYAPPAVPAPAPSPAHVGLPPAPPAPPAAPAAAGPVMLPAANGVPYEAYKANGWTDDQLRANGLMA